MNAKITITLMGFLVVVCLVMPHASAQGVPHSIIGYVMGQDEVGVAGATVTLTNQRTGETVSATSNAFGQYQVELYYMSDGYQIGDVIHVEAVSGDQTGDATVTVTGNAFDQCDITIGEGQGTFPLAAIVSAAVVIVIVVAVVIFIYSSSKHKKEENGENRKGRRRG